MNAGSGGIGQGVTFAATKSAGVNFNRFEDFLPNMEMKDKSEFQVSRGGGEGGGGGGGGGGEGECDGITASVDDGSTKYILTKEDYEAFI